jgi:pilus assembly protein CpaD
MITFAKVIFRCLSLRACRLLTITSVGAVLCGCNQTHPLAREDTYPIDYRERHPITLKQGEYKVEVFLSRNRGGLTPDQRADVLAFAQQWRHEAESGVAIDEPSGASIARAAGESTREILSIMAAAGVPRRAIFVRKYSLSPEQLPTINLSYSKLTAIAGPCGQWPADLGPSIHGKDYENHPYWNFGCATQRNLASMVADPADLVQPRGEAPVYAPRRSLVIEKYSQGQNPSATYNGNTGRISDIGK